MVAQGERLVRGAIDQVVQQCPTALGIDSAATRVQAEAIGIGNYHAALQGGQDIDQAVSTAKGVLRAACPGASI
jgi:hypothetical protein